MLAMSVLLNALTARGEDGLTPSIKDATRVTFMQNANVVCATGQVLSRTHPIGSSVESAKAKAVLVDWVLAEKLPCTSKDSVIVVLVADGFILQLSLQMVGDALAAMGEDGLMPLIKVAARTTSMQDSNVVYVIHLEW
mmetsp:Transcript_2257/g.3522  ORF Transcript_2257/g.3522 Transcript_2257/m.3522 type:complete len:138 (-) Transcript_2257:734-1147(-)